MANDYYPTSLERHLGLVAYALAGNISYTDKLSIDDALLKAKDILIDRLLSGGLPDLIKSGILDECCSQKLRSKSLAEVRAIIEGL